MDCAVLQNVVASQATLTSAFEFNQDEPRADVRVTLATLAKVSSSSVLMMDHGLELPHTVTPLTSKQFNLAKHHIKTSDVNLLRQHKQHRVCCTAPAGVYDYNVLLGNVCYTA